MTRLILVLGTATGLFVICVAYRTRWLTLRVFAGPDVSALLSWGLWKRFHS